MDKYEIIATVYREKSISKAAEKLNYTHSAVSQTVKIIRIEAWVSHLPQDEIRRRAKSLL